MLFTKTILTVLLTGLCCLNFLAAQPLPCRNTGFTVQSACAGNPFTFTAKSGATTYKWNFGDGTPEQTLSVIETNHRFTAAGSYQVRLIRLGVSCTDTVFQTVKVSDVPPVPDFSFAPNDVPCSGAEIGFSVNNLNPAYTYFWVFESGDTLTGSSVRKVLRVFGEGNQSAKVILIASENGCTSQIEKNVSLKAEPRFSFITNSDECLLCNERELTLTLNTPEVSQVDSVIISWGDNQKLKLTDNFNTTFTRAYAGIGDYSLEILVYGKNGCIGRHGCQIKIDTDLNPLEDFVITGGNDAGCNPYEAEIKDLTGDIGPTTVLTLNFGDGSPEQVFIGKSFGTVRHTFRNDQNCVVQYPISLSGVSQCYQIIEKRVKFFTVFRPPVLRASVDNPNKCTSDSVTIVNLTLPIIGVCGGDTSRNPRTDYRWNWGDGTPEQRLTIQNNTLPQQFLKHKYAKKGIYSFYLEACERRYTPDALGSCRCADTIINITVNDKPTVLPIAISAERVLIPDTVTGGLTVLRDHTLNVTSRKWSISPSGGWKYESGSSDTSKVSTVRFSTPGNYTVMLTVENECGSAVIRDTVAVIAPPKLNCPDIRDGCPPRSFNPANILASDGNGPLTAYSWQVFRNDTLIASCSSASPVPPCTSFTEAGKYRLVCAFTNVAGTASCHDTFTVLPLVTLKPLSKDTILVPDDVTGKVLTLKNSSQNATSYTWDILPATGWSYEPGSSPASFEPLVKFILPGNYTVRLTARNACNTLSSDAPQIGNPPHQGNGSVIVICPPKITHPPTPDGCSPKKLDLTALQILNGNGPILSYLWTVFFNGVELDSCRSAAVTLACTDFKPAGTYIIRLICTNIAGSGEWADTFIVHPIPPAPAAENDTICQGKTANLSCSAQPTDQTEWLDRPTDPSPLFIGNPFITPPLNESRDYYCRNRAKGCPGEVTAVRVVVVPLPECVMEDSLRAACGSPVRFGRLMSFDTTGLRFKWSPAEGLSCDTCLRTFCKVNESTSFTLTVTNRTGCVSSCRQAVKVIPLPVVEAICVPPSCEICECEQITINALPKPNLKVRWYDRETGGNLLFIGNSYLTEKLCTHTSFYIEGEDSLNRCITPVRLIKTVRVNPNPVCLAWNRPNVRDTTVTCGTPVLMGSPEATDSLTYQWLPAAGLNQTDIARPTAVLAATTTYTCTAVNRRTGCKSVCSFTINVVPGTFAKAWATDSLICQGQSTVLTADPSDERVYTYRWFPETGLDNPAAARPVCTPNATAVYHVEITDRAVGCADKASVKVSVAPPATLKMTDSLTICPDVNPCIQINPRFKGTLPYTFSWFPADGVSDASILNPDFCPKKTTQYILTATDGAGCFLTDSILIRTGNPLADFSLVYESLTVSGSDSRQVVIDGKETVSWGNSRPCESNYAQVPAKVDFRNRSVNASRYLWIFGDGTSGTQAAPTHIYTRKGEYCIRLVAFGAEGCTDTLTFCKLKVADVCETLLDCIEVPNAFSPNGDNVNPEFFIPYLRYRPDVNVCLEEYKLEIFDRWGHLIFVSLRPEKGWDGKEFNGNSLIESEQMIYENVFVWKLSLKTNSGYQLLKVGNVTVLK